MDSSIISYALERFFHPRQPKVIGKLRRRDAALRAESEISQLLDWLGKANFDLQGMTVRFSVNGIEIGGGDWPFDPDISNHHSISFDVACPATLFAAVIDSNRASFEKLFAWHLMEGRGYFDQKGIVATSKIARVTAA